MVGLYPKIDIELTTKEVGEEVAGTEMKYDNVDYRMAGILIASNLTQDQVNQQGLSKIVPRRKKKTGVRPGPTTKELQRKRTYNEEGEEVEESKWGRVKKMLNEEDKRKLIENIHGLIPSIVLYLLQQCFH